MITVGFSTHRLEVLPEAASLMERHDVIALEEPPHPRFHDMLRGEATVQEYLEESDYEFPRFAEASCQLYRRLHASGKRLVQVDPYMEHLNRLHEFFADGGDHHALDSSDPALAVYRAEREATAALLQFYAASVTAPFPEVVKAVVRFARADAARIALRDGMRAKRLAVEARAASTLYVESGYIHWRLFQELKRLIGSERPVRPCFLMEREARRRIGKKQVLGPGDLLTLLFVFHARVPEWRAELLAARSLVYIKVLHKDEMEPGERPCPHLEDEVEAARWTRDLSLEDCARLWPVIRSRNPAEAKSVLRTCISQRLRP